MGDFVGAGQRAVARLAVACAALGLSACGSSWVGAWQGTADIGPVSAHTLLLELDDEASSRATLTGPDGRETPHEVCAQRVAGRRLTLELVARPGSCAKGPRLRLEGQIGARVIHGSIYEGKRKTGFFRAFPKPPPEPEVRAE